MVVDCHQCNRRAGPAIPLAGGTRGPSLPSYTPPPVPQQLVIVLAVLAAYVVGSVDFAVLVGRMHGVSITEVGSGNPGTSNVLRTLGRGPAAMVFAGDLVKGVIGAAMATVAAGTADPQSIWTFVGGLAAVLGHCYPLFHRFKGGKGVATSAGVVAFALPVGVLVLAVVWLVTVGLTKVASIGSLSVVALAIPVALWQGVSAPAIWVLGVIVALVVWRHRGNIERMLGGGERKVLQ